MRRAIAVAVMGGLVLAGAVATPSLAAAHQAAPPAKPRARCAVVQGQPARRASARPKAHAQPATVMKTVVYGGYQFQVPASWPVYRLDEHPQTCVRYDVHAVYLGRPGPDMRCAAGLVGQTETVSFIPPARAPRPGLSGGSRHPAAPEAAGGTELQPGLTAGHGTMTENTVKHKLGQVTLGATPGADWSLARTGPTRQSSSRCSAPCTWPRPAPRRPRSPRRCRRSQRGPGAGPRCRPSARPRTRSARPPRPRGARRHLRTTAAGKASARPTPKPTSTEVGAGSHWPVDRPAVPVAVEVPSRRSPISPKPSPAEGRPRR